MVMPSGTSEGSAFATMALKEPLRRLPHMEITLSFWVMQSSMASDRRRRHLTQRASRPGEQITQARPAEIWWAVEAPQALCYWPRTLSEYTYQEPWYAREHA